MSFTISIRFLTGRAHLHPWQTHHSEGRAEWPPSHWRLLRALVAIAGRGLTSLPDFDVVPALRSEPVVAVAEMSKPKERGVPLEGKKKLSFSKSKQTLALKEPLTDAEANAWKAANPGESFATALDQLQTLAAAPDPVALGDERSDELLLSRLAGLLHALSAMPTIWVPKTSGGHTRQYFPIHDAGMVKNTGSAVFDTFAAVRKDQPLCFHWPELQLDEQQQGDLKLLLLRMTYFGRAESWCRAEIHICPPDEIKAEGISPIALDKTHWKCLCIEDGGKPAGEEYRDYLLERRLAPVEMRQAEVVDLLPRTKASDGKNRKEAESFKSVLQAESPEKLLLRCLLRESGQDIKDGLERPIGTRWIHYAVPRAIFAVPRPRPQSGHRTSEQVDLVRYALNTATIGRPVLPALTDTLLVADKFRSAVMALCDKPGQKPGQCLSGHEENGSPCKGHLHAFWWPLDEDNDGFIDHVMVWSRGGFGQNETDALRRLTRLRQRGGRPDLLVTPTYTGRASEYKPWLGRCFGDGSSRVRAGRASEYKPWLGRCTTTFVSVTPYFCPLSLSHRGTGSGRLRPITRVIREGLRHQGIDDEVVSIEEIVFDYSPERLQATLERIALGKETEPIAPRQYFPLVPAPTSFPPLPRLQQINDPRFRNACVKDPDLGYPFGVSVGLLVDRGTRFVRTLSFCRRRRHLQVKGDGRMFVIQFKTTRDPRPFALGDQCHFGLGLFVPTRPVEEE